MENRIPDDKPTIDLAEAIQRANAAADLAFGTIDAMVGLGVALANAGVISRKDIVKALDQIIDQQKQRDGDSRPCTKAALIGLRAFFDAPVFDGKPN
jgi:hypothetical protein